MKLIDYLKQENISVQDGADEIGVSRQAFNRYLTGSRRPHHTVMPRIREWTNGAVTADDFFEPSPAE